jgi:hypothetical protein
MVDVDRSEVHFIQTTLDSGDVKTWQRFDVLPLRYETEMEGRIV